MSIQSGVSVSTPNQLRSELCEPQHYL